MENKLKKLTQHQLLIGQGWSNNSMSFDSDKENSSVGSSLSDVSTYAPVRGYPILGQQRWHRGDQTTCPMTESMFNVRLSQPMFSESMRQAVSPSHLQSDEDAGMGATALMPPHYDIMGRSLSNISQCSSSGLDQLFNAMQTEEENESSPESWYSNILGDSLNDSGLSSCTNRWTNQHDSKYSKEKLETVPPYNYTVKQESGGNDSPYNLFPRQTCSDYQGLQNRL